MGETGYAGAAAPLKAIRSSSPQTLPDYGHPGLVPHAQIGGCYGPLPSSGSNALRCLPHGTFLRRCRYLTLCRDAAHRHRCPALSGSEQHPKQLVQQHCQACRRLAEDEYTADPRGQYPRVAQNGANPDAHAGWSSEQLAQAHLHAAAPGYPASPLRLNRSLCGVHKGQAEHRRYSIVGCCSAEPEGGKGQDDDLSHGETLGHRAAKPSDQGSDAPE